MFTPGFVEIPYSARNVELADMRGKENFCRVCDDETSSYDHGGHICPRCSKEAASCDDLGAQFAS